MNPTFKFGHDIFADAKNRPVFTGKIEIEIVREPLYSFTKESLTWEEQEFVTQKELNEILALENGDFNWQEIEPTNESEIYSRYTQAACNGFVLRDGESVETTVTLQPGSSFEYSHSWPTEEGYGSQSIEASWIGDGWEIERNSGGRDCDGVLNNTHKYFHGLDGIQTRGKTEVYDQYAQLAGY